MPRKDPRHKLQIQRRFAAIYVQNGRNASAAYRELYPNCGGRTSGIKGYLWLREPEVIMEIEKLTEELAKSREAAAQLTQMVNSRQLALNMAIGEREQAKEAAMELYRTLAEGDDKRSFIERWDWLEDGEL